MSISKLRGMLYGTAKVLGDLQAVLKGPKAVVRRVQRRVVGKVTGRLLGKLFPPSR